MKKVLYSAGLLVFLLLAYLLFWPIPADPRPYQAPGVENADAFRVNDKLKTMKLIDIGDTVGPEDIALDRAGNIYTAMLGGQVLKMRPDGAHREVYVNTGGRPLGLVFDREGNLIIADPYRGLLKVTPDRKIHELTDRSEDGPICYANNVDIASDGMIYFTDSSTRFCPRDYGGTYGASILDIIEHSGTGRFLSFNPATGETKTLLKGLQFANGVALSEDQNVAIIAETGGFRIHRYWLKGERRGQSDVILSGLPGYPDNVTRGIGGRFWVGFTKARSKLLDKYADSPFMRRIILRLPEFMYPIPPAFGHILAFDREGKIVASLQDPAPVYPDTSGATETPAGIFVHSLHAKRVGYLDKKDLNLPD